MKSHAVTALLALALAVAVTGPGTARAAATPPACNPPANVFDVAGTLAPTTPFFILSNPSSPLRAFLLGTGTFQGHVVWQPITAALSDGCHENSRFTVEGFTGIVFVEGPLATTLFGHSPFPLLVVTQPTTASLQVHFGDEPSKPVLTFRSNRPVLLLGQPVQFVQIVGLEIIATH
jgi:hypothetical protein